MDHSSKQRWIGLVLAAVTAACGGGGSGGGRPPAPLNLAATVVSDDVELTWDAVEGATEYRVYRSWVPAVAATEHTLVATVLTTNATITGLPLGAEFHFAVAARVSSKQSLLSNVSAATIPHVAGADPLFGQQWHLVNSGQLGGTIGEDVDVQPAWTAGWSGAGVRVAMVDDGLELMHPDLAANVAPGLSRSYVNEDFQDPTGGYHGTACAGIVAAVRQNSLGGCGTAFDAKIVGYDLLQEFTSSNQADAMTRGAADVWVSSNSWGVPDLSGNPIASSSAWKNAIVHGTTVGRGGLGTVYVFAAGNGAELSGVPIDNSNLDGYVNVWGVLAVGAVGDDGVRATYSERGANLLVCAPSLGHGDHGITTSDRSGAEGYNDGVTIGDYPDAAATNGFGGTSAAAPLVSGVVALMLEANPNLGWRDVRLILAQTARRTDLSDIDWVQNGAGHWVNHDYGFGVVDAAAAVAAAETWVNVGPLVQFTTSARTPDLDIPDDDFNGVVDQMVVTGSGIQDLEFVRIVFDADDHTASGDLVVLLESPSGTVSVLAEPHGQPLGSTPYNGWFFGSTRELDEPADGTWTLRVLDVIPADVGTFKTWRLLFYGR